MTRSVNGHGAHTQRRSAKTPALRGHDAPDQAPSPGGPADVRPGSARIAVDLLGGDDAPAVVVDGALRACGADPDLHLLLVGPPDVADEVIGLLAPADRARVRVRAVQRAVGVTDVPVRGRHADATVGAAVAALAEGHADAMVSAGPSGATVTAAALGLGRLAGVRHPALAATLPGVEGPVVLLDVGASTDAGPATLARYAVLGAAYAHIRHDLPEPRVGLLSIGAEAGKGDRARRAAEPVVAAQPLPAGARYVGLVEGHDVSLGGPADVVVADGFTGNVLLKGVEGAYRRAGSPVPASEAPRGALLLGVPGTVVVCHGAASGLDIASGIALAAELHRAGVVGRLSALAADLAEVMP